LVAASHGAAFTSSGHMIQNKPFKKNTYLLWILKK